MVLKRLIFVEFAAQLAEHFIIGLVFLGVELAFPA
jgi:hypothetical protein